MRRLILLVVLVLFGTVAYSQIQRGNRPGLRLDPSPGFITINELNAGFGLSGKSTPYSGHFFGFTTINGYQVNDIFLVGGGTGLLFYNDGLLIPLFIDMRARLITDKIAPYLEGAGGVLLNPSELDKGTRMFINPSAGARLTLNRSLGVTASAGLLMQMGSGIGRASFVTLKAGVVYKF